MHMAAQLVPRAASAKPSLNDKMERATHQHSFLSTLEKLDEAHIRLPGYNIICAGVTA